MSVRVSHFTTGRIPSSLCTVSSTKRTAFSFREELVVGLFVSVERNEVEVRQARCGVKNTLEEAIVLIKNLVD